EVGQLGQEERQARFAGQHGVGNAGEAGDKWGELAPWVDEGGELFLDPVALKLDRANLNDGIAGGVKPGGFEVERDDRFGHSQERAFELWGTSDYNMLVWRAGTRR